MARWLRPTTEVVGMDAGRLAEMPLFQDLSKRDRERVATWADEVDLPAGYHLLDQGGFAHEFFVIEEGEVEVRVDDRLIGTLGRGEMLGEIALVNHDTRTASVIASTAVRAIVMGPREFDSMRLEMPKVAERIERTMRERLG
jgi:CRP-like cAMP-binding protein